MLVFPRNNKGFLSILELILVLVIISVLAAIGMRTYLKTSTGTNSAAIVQVQEQNMPSKEAINTTTPRSTVDSVRERINKVEKMQAQQLQELESLGQ